MSRSLNDLSHRFQPTVFEFIARCIEAGVPLLIVDTLRTEEEQKANIARGVSWTPNSKHLPQPPDGKALAIDVVPYSTYLLHGISKLAWESSEPAWLKIGEIGESLGMRWGGRWSTPDYGHFEYKPVQPDARLPRIT